jgi:hypothetical protein
MRSTTAAVAKVAAHRIKAQQAAAADEGSAWLHWQTVTTLAEGAVQTTSAMRLDSGARSLTGSSGNVGSQGGGSIHPGMRGLKRKS